MLVSSMRDHSIDYAPCHYNGSRLWFRGPCKTLQSPYIACLGGCETYGRFVADPWPVRLETMLGRAVVNLGVENTGVDAYLNDAGALCTAAQARLAIIQLTGCHNGSNRYYTVHPRRNDRFVKASSALKALYPEMDFTEVHFTRHMLTRLRSICPDRFALVAEEARIAWHARMQQLIAHMSSEVILFWFAPFAPEKSKDDLEDGEIFLDRRMVERLQPHAFETVELVADPWAEGHDDTTVSPLETGRAARLPGRSAHEAAARALQDAIAGALQ
ncbi:DUF6473 family protein [Marivita sp. GX14005]|uniref:DUF6473 family protein n=1 Tax=Marivita sp. GX14005 TaxID=2942276 RepID=UPI002019D843|nr:DUF6473 family protein [Marivita sp. GX14005]MCL3882127.1 DUF6473 family protein [Marivita sp. GX14005]